MSETVPTVQVDGADDQEIERNMLTVTFFDANGQVTEKLVVPPQTATQAEIDEAIALINGGLDARTAMMLAKQSGGAIAVASNVEPATTAEHRRNPK